MKQTTLTPIRPAGLSEDLLADLAERAVLTGLYETHRDEIESRLVGFPAAVSA